MRSPPALSTTQPFAACCRLLSDVRPFALRARHLHQVHHARASRRPGWDVQTQIREEVYLTKGRVIVRGKLVDPRQGQARRLRPLLQAQHPARRHRGEGQQPLASAPGCSRRSTTPRCSTCPFVFRSNGDGFLFHDRTGTLGPGRAASSRSTSSRRPTTLWARYRDVEGARRRAEDALVTQDYYDGRSAARSRATTSATPSTAPIEAVAKGQNRILLVMATGTGKTYTAFQIIWRLWKAGRQEADPLPRRPQHPGRPDHDERLQAVRRGDDEDHEPQGRQVLRDLPRALPGDHRHRGSSRTSTSSSRPTSST